MLHYDYLERRTREKHYLIGPIHKLQIKFSFVTTAPGLKPDINKTSCIKNYNENDWGALPLKCSFEIL